MKNNKKIAFIVPDFPPFISGYGDYNYNLIKEMVHLNVECYIITTQNQGVKSSKNTLFLKWGVKSIGRIYKYLTKNEVSELNLQYPNIQYGRFNLLPHLLVFVLFFTQINVSVTIHEFSNINIFRRFSEIIFLLFAKKIILTSKYEKNKIAKYFPFSLYKVSVINIGANIPFVKRNMEKTTIAYFGMFYPDKKIREVIDFMEKLQNKLGDKFIFKLVGSSHSLYEEYLINIIEYGNKKIKNVQWIIDQPSNVIENEFKNIYTVVLFYNDGASERRGSLLSAIANGIPLITNQGEFSTVFKSLYNKGIFFEELGSEVINEETMKLFFDEKFYNYCSKELLKVSTKYHFNNIAKKYYDLILK